MQERSGGPLGKQYSYPKWAIGAYGLMILFPIAAWVFLFKTGIQNVFGLFVFSNIFLFAVTTAIVIWVVNLLKTKIYINDAGITYKSLYRNILIKWEDISDIKRKYLAGGTGQYGGPPRELEIRTRNGKTIKVLSILVAINEGDIEEGIKDLESEIKKHIKID